MLIRTVLESHKTNANPKTFFKTGVGDYAEHDKFIGVPVPALRKIAKEFEHINGSDLDVLMASSINEERLLALFILIKQFPVDSKKIYEYYLSHFKYVNNWNLVDASAHHIVGAYLWDKDRSPLLKWAQSNVMWERRIAIVATWYFIKKGDLEWTLKLAEVLLTDKHDLIHKAVGWMLREVGKKDEMVLRSFLDQYSKQMPRTMYRYAIERLKII